MFKSIQYLSVDAMRKLKPSSDTVVISVLDPEEHAKRPKLAGWRSVLVLDFEDTYEENKFSSAKWPDEPTSEEHALFCQVKGHRVPALSDAKRIVEFLVRHGLSTEQLHLVVHCYGGISRSAAIAQWASVRFFVPLDREPAHPNLRLLRLMDIA